VIQAKPSQANERIAPVPLEPATPHHGVRGRVSAPGGAIDSILTATTEERPQVTCNAAFPRNRAAPPSSASIFKRRLEVAPPRMCPVPKPTA